MPTESSAPLHATLPVSDFLPAAGESNCEPPYSVGDLFRDFPDDDACLEYIKEQLWPGGIVFCPRCAVERKHHRVYGRKAYACNHCGRHIYPLAGTVFSRTKTPLKTWFYILYLLCATRGDLSGKQLQRETGTTYKTAWRSRAQILRVLPSDSVYSRRAGEDGLA